MVNYVYSASSVLNGLVSAGCAPQKQAELARFILSTQQVDPDFPAIGGWGEAPTGYASNRYVAGKPTIMQTSVAVVGLTAYYEGLQRAGAPVAPELVEAIEKGIAFLLARTRGGTAPIDAEYNGVLIRGVTYARYELAPAYLAFYALGRWERASQAF
jgi:squalene cyclase